MSYGLIIAATVMTLWVYVKVIHGCKLFSIQTSTAELVVNFGCPIHISGIAEARAIKFCTKGDYIKSCQRHEKIVHASC